ncbi:hypothetical protein HWQ46_09400 [Shewanella sp. D64]|uniref:hypothetical protein n=1 Tax=unclassified Shewanella TaxID=196818 RepID=UPI0022BA57F0|nr:MULTISPECIES: hypothetical protein [unclassified Shewanella]MEC4725757.1 hypothetical protein [Shewanella sp. D64]MEC4737636.1 hypothetical protein [Shewanella sp. E94]WBJ93446.1 hypothetical protein HWQ47_16085 [Shewanella sp. MTB7]
MPAFAGIFVSAHLSLFIVWFITAVFSPLIFFGAKPCTLAAQTTNNIIVYFIIQFKIKRLTSGKRVATPLDYRAVSILDKACCID